MSLPSLLIIITSSIFLLSSAVNNGLFGYLCTIPFWILLFFGIRNFSGKYQAITFFSILSIFIFIIKTHDINPVIFPVIGKNLVTEGDWYIERYKNTYYLYPHEKDPSIIRLSNAINEDRSLNSYSIIGIDNSNSTNYSDHIAVIQNNTGQEFRIHTSSIKRQIDNRNIISKELKGLEPHQYQSDISKIFSSLAIWPLSIVIAAAYL